MAQLTTAEAADLLGIAEATLNAWRTRNVGPAYTKTGRLVRYPDYEIERWIRERTIQTSHRKRPQKEVREVGISIQTERKSILSGHRFKGRGGKRFGSAGSEGGAS
jgi:predicted DNA-binding transcriptional regulator AlpA